MDRGLSVWSAEKLNARGLDEQIRRPTGVARKVKARRLNLAARSFTLNNYDDFGVDGSAAIINNPEFAILGAARIIDKPGAVDGSLAVRKH